MGQRISRPRRSSRPSGMSSHSGAITTTRGVKRRSEFDSDDEEDADGQRVKRVRLDATGDFIYETMFLGGQNTDVVVTYQERRWDLHRMYLGQSKYFKALFDGGWEDSDRDIVHLPVVDDFVTQEAVNVALGSMYNGVVTLRTVDVVAISAASSLLQLGPLLEKCGEFMLSDVKSETAAIYFLAADRYGLQDVREKALEWLSYNALNYGMNAKRCLNTLRKLPPFAVELLLNRLDFVAAPCETFVYHIVATWIYMHLHEMMNDPIPDVDGLMANAKTYFGARPGPAFILSEEGRPYRRVLRALKLKQIVMYPADMQCLKSDKIFDDLSVFTASNDCWNRHLHLTIPRFGVNAAVDTDPQYGAPQYVWGEEGGQLLLTMNSEAFFDGSSRFGKFLSEPGIIWRWTCYVFGVRFFMSAASDRVDLTYLDETSVERLVTPDGLPIRDSRFLVIRMRYFEFKDRGLKLIGDTGIFAEETFNRDRCLSWEPSHFHLRRTFPYPAVIALEAALCRREELRHPSPDEKTPIFPIGVFIG